MRCPDCAAKGKNGWLRKYSVNYTESVYLCDDHECDYLAEAPESTSSDKCESQVQQTMESLSRDVESLTMQGHQPARTAGSNSTEDDSSSLEMDVKRIWDVLLGRENNEPTKTVVVEAVPELTSPSITTPGCNSHEEIQSNCTQVAPSTSSAFSATCSEAITSSEPNARGLSTEDCACSDSTEVKKNLNN